MKFIDETVIFVKAGHGGAGSRHFRREKFVPFGGPDGGNGGRGGSVILKAVLDKQTLLDLHFKPNWVATDGGPGGGSNKDGKFGEDLVIPVPIGTQIFSEIDGEIVVDLDRPDAEFVLASGGRGGKGNAFFKTATNQTPEYAQPGEAGHEGSYRLSLKLVADVGLVGFPNAGKSTLISRISAARPKIADYPFTTLEPNLGVVKGKGRTFVVADIPGLIPGAHAGKGLGIQFLKHIERTRVIVHLVDLTTALMDSTDALYEAYEQINHELTQFSEEVSGKPQIVALTKSDSVTPEVLKECLAAFKARGLTPLVISSASGAGLPELISMIERILGQSEMAKVANA